MSSCSMLAVVMSVQAAWVTPLHQLAQEWVDRAHGMPMSSVEELAVTPDGVLWAATEEGLVQWDGTSVRVWDGLNSPITAEVRSVTVTPEGQLLAGTGRGLFRVAGGAVSVATDWGDLSQESVLRVRVASDGALWWQADEARVLRVALGGAREEIPVGARVLAWAEAPGGVMWLGGSKLWRWHAGALEEVPTPLSSRSYVQSMLVDSRGRLWLGSEQVLRQAGASFEVVHLPTAQPFEARAMLEDREHSVWVAATGLGVLRLAALGDGEVELLKSARTSRWQALVEDATGATWLASTGAGLLQLRRGAVVTFGPQDGLDGPAWSITEGPSGDLWVSAGALLHLDGSGRMTRIPPPEPTAAGTPRAIHAEADGSVLVATRGGSVERFARGEWATVIERLSPTRPLVHSVATGPDGRHYFGTLCEGVFVLEGTSVRSLGHPKTCVPALRWLDGRLWAGTDRGLLRLDDGGRLQPVSGIDVGVWSIEAPRPGVLWLSTDGHGLLQLDGDTGRVSACTRRHGLGDDRLYGLAIDGSGGVWQSSNQGLFRLEQGELERCFATGSSVHPQRFTERDGMLTAECSGGIQPSVLLTREGRLAVGTARGLALVDTRGWTPPPPPRPRLGSVQVGALDGGVLTVDSERRRLEVEVTTVDLADAPSVTFRFRLEGVDSDWQQSGHQRHLTYTNLPPGDFTLRVQAGREWGTWSAEELRLPVRVEPRYHERTLFRLGAMLLLLGGLMVLALCWSRAQRRRREALEEKVRERTAQLHEAMQAAEAANEAKSAFLANMSHEIRTPMGAVLGAAELLRLSPLTADQRELVELTHTSGTALLSLINDILDLSKAEAGRIELEEHAWRPLVAAREALDVAQLAARAKGVQLLLHHSEDVPAQLLGDSLRVRQVLLNLLGNAVKFTPPGGTVTVTLARREGALSVEVSDTGPGIPAERLERLFRPFSQADASTTRTHGGTGLGLAIAKRLVELMGGAIGVRSEPGHGATFWFTLPCRLAEGVAAPTVAATPATAPAPAPASLSHLAVLLAEDNPLNRAVELRLLERLGVKADVVVTGAEAVRAAARRDYDVILMDVQMPELDGLAATRAIRAQADGRQPCIIALTASAMAEERAACLAAGMDAFLSKPLSLHELQTTLASARRAIRST